VNPTGEPKFFLNMNQTRQVLHPRRNLSAFTLIELLVLASAKAKAMQTGCLNNLKQLQLSWVMYCDDNTDNLPTNNKTPANTTPNWVNGNVANAADAADITLIQSGQIYSYNKSVAIYRCPADKLPDNRSSPAITSRVRTYSMNCYMNGADIGATHAGLPAGLYKVNKKTADIRHPAPSLAMVFLEEAQYSIDDGQFGFSPSGLPGNGPVNTWYNIPAMVHRGSNFAFADNHVEFRRWLEASTKNIASMPYTDPGPTFADLRWVQNVTATQ
jgi:prepilin-type processing-associated H-X9-DG protein